MTHTLLSVATDVRVKFEDYFCDEDHDLSALDNMCATMSRDLCDALREAGFDARRVPGQYVGMSDDYAPDTSEWEGDDVDAYEADPRMAHWWVVCDGQIIDICADQFHPSDRLNTRTIITDEGDADYDPLHGFCPDEDAEDIRPS